MVKFGESRWVLVCSALCAGTLIAGGCSSSGSSGSGTGGSTTGTGGGDATGLGGNATGSGGNTGLGGATGTGGVVQKDCAVKTAVVSAPIINFDDYDGVSQPDQYSTAFNAAPGEPNAVYVGPYFYPDATGTPFSGMVAGNNSNYGMSVSNPAASEWGGGMGLWMGCVDATGYQGISFYVRGTAPLGNGSMSLAMEDTSPPAADDPAGGGTCIATGTSDSECSGPSAEFPVTDNWTLIQIPWSGFTPGTAAAGVSVPATGNNITGMSFNVNLQWIANPADPSGDWIPVEAAYELVVDDVAFY